MWWWKVGAVRVKQRGGGWYKRSLAARFPTGTGRGYSACFAAFQSGEKGSVHSAVPAALPSPSGKSE